MTKKRRKGQGKGASFEREMCRSLSWWVSSGTREDLFWRSAMSGGRATMIKKKGGGSRVAYQVGDISAINEHGLWLIDHYMIECKFVKALDVGTACYGRGGLLSKFWGTLVCEAHDYLKHPFLLAKQNNFPTLIGLPVDWYRNHPRACPTPLVIIPHLKLALWGWEDFQVRVAYPEFQSWLKSS